MNNFKRLIMEDTLRIVLILACIVVFCAGLFLVSSWKGWPSSAYQLAEPVANELAQDSDIEGWAAFDKDSYFMGEIVTFRLIVKFRGDNIAPNFDTFRNYMSFQPFEQREINSNLTDIGGGFKEYKIEYVLQAMGSKLSGSYAFNPAVLYYKKFAEQSDDLHALRIQLPQIYIASYYPFDITGIALLDINGMIEDPIILRQVFMMITGIMLLGLALTLLWAYGRRRHMHELSVPEQLWRRFNEFRDIPMDNRTFLLHCEKIFSGLLTGYVQVSPEKFWSSAQVDYGNVTGIIPKVRAILRRIYKISDPSEADVEELTVLIEETLSSLVEEERLRTEMEPAFISRISKQPKVVAFTSLLGMVSVISLFLSSQPLLCQPRTLSNTTTWFRHYVAGLL